MNKVAEKIMKHFGIKKINGIYNAIIIWGHWKPKGRICDKIKRHWELKHGIASFDLDESWTSQVHYEHEEHTKTGEIVGICKPVHLQKIIGRKTHLSNKLKWTIKSDKPLSERPLKTVRIWHLLQCDKCKKYIHRDKNGCLNILKIGLDILNYNFRFFPRYMPSNTNSLDTLVAPSSKEQQEQPQVAQLHAVAVKF